METSSFTRFLGKRLHIGVTGSVAAYRMLDLVRQLQRDGCTVSATVTDAAAKFVTPLAFQACGADPVYTAMFGMPQSTGGTPFPHLEPGMAADALLIAPATANILAKMAHGLADDVLSCQALAFDGPILVAPAMNPRMYAAQATQANLAALRERGVVILEPASGNVACGETGQGKLVSLDTLRFAALRALCEQDMAGRSVLVALGPTREPWDAIRFWSNPSSGRMGIALATAAWLRGAEVTAVCGPVIEALPFGIKRIDVTTAQEMFDAVTDRFPSCDIAAMVAAVADFKPTFEGTGKFKKQGADHLSISFASNPDILRHLGSIKKPHQRLIGFAAETGDPTAEAKRKLADKNLDLILANRIDVAGSGFGSETNQVHALAADGREETWPELPKTEVAWRIWDLLQLT